MRSDDGRVVSNLLVQALRGQPLTVYGDGSQTRSFCYVDDLVDGILRRLDLDDPYPVNIGNPEEIPVVQLAREILELTGSSARIVHQPLPEDDPKRRRPDITRARTLLGWSPKVDRRTGLERTVAYFRGILAQRG
jgi:nucleoside-diphosphate-sugar epimerase